MPILALTPITKTARRLQLVWGVHCEEVAEVERFKKAVINAVRVTRKYGFGTEKDQILVTAGIPFNQPGTTNILRVAPCAEHLIVSGEPE